MGGSYAEHAHRRRFRSREQVECVGVTVDARWERGSAAAASLVASEWRESQTPCGCLGRSLELSRTQSSLLASLIGVISCYLLLHVEQVEDASERASASRFDRSL